MEAGAKACILPWQRDEIRDTCGMISAAVRPRPSYGDSPEGPIKKLTLVGPPLSDFPKALAAATEYIKENFEKGITCALGCALLIE